MKVQLFSVHHAPSTLPLWQLILDDLSNPPARQVAKVLGVGLRTVYRWNHAGHAPRAATLALYWLTRWGRSAVHTQAVNDALMAVALARSLERERDALQATLAGIGASPAAVAASGHRLGHPSPLLSGIPGVQPGKGGQS